MQPGASAPSHPPTQSLAPVPGPAEGTSCTPLMSGEHMCSTFPRPCALAHTVTFMGDLVEQARCRAAAKRGTRSCRRCSVSHRFPFPQDSSLTSKSSTQKVRWATCGPSSGGEVSSWLADMYYANKQIAGNIVPAGGCP